MLDREKYLKMMDGDDMPLEQKEEHLKALETVMQHFVDLAFGMESTQIIVDQEKLKKLKNKTL